MGESYVIESELGRGAYGVAYLAKQQRAFLPMSVVVKVPTDMAVVDMRWAEKFKREARILANIRHENVVSILAFYETADEMAIVQEYVQGAKNVCQFIQEYADGAPSLLLQALYALRALHSDCAPAIVHRDLSPRNILVDSNRKVKVIDFGIAKEDPRETRMLTKTGDWFGTAGCLAPEQTTNYATVDHRADLYTLGRTFTAAIQQRMPEHAVVSELDEPWRELCQKLTRYRPEDRHQTPDDALAHAMQLFADHNVNVWDMEIHMTEMRKLGATAPWSALCQTYFANLPDYNAQDIRLASLLSSATFGIDFDADDFFDRIESSGGIAEYEAGNLAFSAADDLSTLYEGLYPHLDATRRKAAYRRICRAAIKYHRYSAMGGVRALYALEPDPFLKAEFVQILNEEDPERVIEGRGVIPR